MLDGPWGTALPAGAFTFSFFAGALHEETASPVGRCRLCPFVRRTRCGRPRGRRLRPRQGATAQQTRIKTCNADAGAKNLKGDERKAFMKECLSGNKASTQQDKMKSCNADAVAKNLKGDARKAFMKECLSGAAS